MLRKRKGSILILTMFVSAVLILFAGIMLQQTVLNILLIEKTAGVNKTYWIALAGINRQKHDLREYYFQHQMEFVEREVQSRNRDPYRPGSPQKLPCVPRAV